MNPPFERQILQVKSQAFSIRILNMQKYLKHKFRGLEAISQVSRCGTSIGANVAEAFCAQSDADFVARLHISYKEAKETEHWIIALHGSGYLTVKEYQSIINDCQELLKLLTHTLKKKKASMEAKGKKEPKS